MGIFIKIVSLGFITGMVSMLIIKVIKHLTRDKEEDKQFYTVDEIQQMRKRCYERMKEK